MGFVIDAALKFVHISWPMVCGPNLILERNKKNTDQMVSYQRDFRMFIMIDGINVIYMTEQPCS